MTGLKAAQEARTLLGQRIAALRRDAGLTQRDLGVRTGYSRSAVARAETSGACSRPFCVRAGRALGVDGELASAHDRAAALTIAARADAARRARDQRSRPPPGPEGEDTGTLILAHDMTCPHCGKPVAVLIRQDLSLLPLEAG